MDECTVVPLLVIFEGAEILSMSADSRTKDLKSNETQLVMSKLNANDRQCKSGPSELCI
jgi:hypothetical protein